MELHSWIHLCRPRKVGRCPLSCTVAFRLKTCHSCGVFFKFFLYQIRAQKELGNESACVKKLFRKLTIWWDFFKIHLLVAHDLWWITNVRNNDQVNYIGIWMCCCAALSSPSYEFWSREDVSRHGHHNQGHARSECAPAFVISNISVSMFDISLTWTPCKPNQIRILPDTISQESWSKSHGSLISLKVMKAKVLCNILFKNIQNCRFKK